MAIPIEKYTKKYRSLDRTTLSEIHSREASTGSASIKDVLLRGDAGSVVTAGRLILTDTSGKFSRYGTFSTKDGRELINLERLQDETGSVELYLPRNETNERLVNQQLGIGDLVEVNGTVNTDKESGNSILVAERLLLLTKCARDLYGKPVDRDFSSVADYIKNHNKVEGIIQTGRVLQAVRETLYADGFIEVATPVLVPDFEAGLTKPFAAYSEEKRRDLYLRVTGEVYFRKLMAMGLRNVFEISRSFRNTQRTALTNPEFTVVEIYQAYSGHHQMMNLYEELFLKVLNGVFGRDYIETPGSQILCKPPWKRIDFLSKFQDMFGFPYTEQIDISKTCQLMESKGIEPPQKHDLYNVANTVYNTFVAGQIEPAFVLNSPTVLSPMSKKASQNSGVTAEAVAVINGMMIGDILSAERNLLDLKNRLSDQQELREEGGRQNAGLITSTEIGIPPCGGIGFGIERWLMLFMQKSRVQEVQLFPTF